MSGYNPFPLENYPYMQENIGYEENNKSSNWKIIIAGLCFLALIYILFFRDSGNAGSSNTGSGSTGSGSTGSGSTGSGSTGSGNAGSGNVPQSRFEVLSDRWFSKPFQSITKDMETCQAKWGANNCEIINYGLSRAAIHKCELQAQEKGITDITNWKGISRATNGLKNPYCVNKVTAPFPEYELDPTASDTPQTYKDWYKKMTTPATT